MKQCAEQFELKRMAAKWLFGLMLLSGIMAGAAGLPQWDMAKLETAPAWRVAPKIKSKYPNIRGIFYEGLAFGKMPSTQVFAWLGLPERTTYGKVPAMVLIHGGGGTAFEEWVKLWTDRGYAAIAMDTSGCIPGGDNSKRPRHKDGGPGGFGGFATLDSPAGDQWAYHAVADVILANSLLRSLPEVDPERIVVTGISWGGYLTCISAGTDSRFKLAVPVYGCGFFNEAGSNMKKALDGIGQEKTVRWMARWDASNYLEQAKMPFLWISGTNDVWFPLTSLTKSLALTSGQKNLCVKVRLVHGQGQGQSQSEIFAFADAILNNGVSLPEINAAGQIKTSAWIDFRSKTPLKEAALIFTRDGGPINGRKWETAPAMIKDNRVTADIPSGTTAWFFNLTDTRGLTVSSKFKECSSGGFSGDQ